MVRLERMIMKAVKAMKQARTSIEWAQSVRHYNRLQERYAKVHGGNIYAPYEAVNTPERQYHD